MPLDPDSEVVGPNGILYSISEGDPWPAPFRGLRVTVTGDGTMHHRRKSVREHSFRLHNTGNIGIKALSVKSGSAGSIRITGNGNVITKVRDERTGYWVPKFVGKLNSPLYCEGFDLDPREDPLGRKYIRGRLWPGFCFEGGERWSVSSIGSRTNLFFKFKGEKVYTVQSHPELCYAARSMRSRGGRLYISPLGHIWMNIPLQQATGQGNKTVARGIAQDNEVYSAGHLHLSLQMIKERIDVTGCHPIYIGHTSEFDGGKTPAAMIRYNPESSSSEDSDDEDRW